MTAAAPQTSSQLAPGYKLDRYELLCPIAEGGMASVWVARQRGKHGFEKLVAIKTILPKFAADIRFQEMFLDEARIAARIEHLNVAQILDLGEEHEILYLAMEYVDGDAVSKLNRACQKKGVKIPTGIVLRVMADTCAGLHEAHELKDPTGRLLEIVHRDVSPHNVLVSTKGIAKLIDFGIAKARSRVGTDTNSGVLKGKIQYMAPEQALGRPVDRRADVWAVGAIVYHLLAGKPPYEGDNQLATLHLLGSGRPPVPLPPGIHPSIAGVVRKALAHAPENRYATAAELREAIEDAMIEAMVPTNVADVAAFSSEHLADRAERRKQAVDIALAAAAERRRVEDLLRPTSERTSVTGQTPHSAPRPIPQPLQSADSVPVRGEAMTIPEAPMPKGSPFDAAKLTARISEAPPNAQSYATLGSAALDASQPELPQPKSRKAVFLVVALLGVAALAATGVSFTMFRPKPLTAAAGGAPATTTVAVSAAATPVTASAAPPDPPTATTTSSTAAGIPTYAASSLPKVTPKVPMWTPPPVRWTPPPATAAPQATTPPKTKPKVDDGF
ncbi:MAG TPA: serine/threonine-protein kinase [Polyangiaceae bacterium]